MINKKGKMKFKTIIFMLIILIIGFFVIKSMFFDAKITEEFGANLVTFGESGTFTGPTLYPECKELYPHSIENHQSDSLSSPLYRQNLQRTYVVIHRKKYFLFGDRPCYILSSRY